MSEDFEFRLPDRRLLAAIWYIVIVAGLSVVLVQWFAELVALPAWPGLGEAVGRVVFVFLWTLMTRHYLSAALLNWESWKSSRTIGARVERIDSPHGGDGDAGIA